ncbi:YbaK/EbsC family protein [Bacillus sp. NEB1478]|uniref:aminoacyl-tRNA deacylase n=1 Tax=Bacillus sp. NEB1478 TaxID=3073816 RepID=UPI0028731776|nr:YbaK/EbsC family protein [Bacillus sp. NEB1478]WNB93867.1 YbaK/EbsC family protein [Bacillus sp. NEB1478]
MEKYHLKIKTYMDRHKIKAEHFVFTDSCHSVKQAARMINAPIDQFVKNICMVDGAGKLIVAIVKGEDRASTSRVSKALQIDKPRLGNDSEILEHTGFPAGGVPSFGFPALYLIDPKVAESEYIFTGGGSLNSLIRIDIQEMITLNNGIVVRVRK